MGDVENEARKLAKIVYGDNYDHSQYETTLNFMHESDKFSKNRCINNFIKLIKNFFILLDAQIESHKQE